MNILILGSGGRENALAWKIQKSPLCENLYVAPGNVGTAEIAENISVQVNDFEKIGTTCLDKKIDLIIVGPEDPLCNGIVDFFAKNETYNHIKVFGPSANGAQLEGSKDFSKEFMFRNNIPTAKYRTFTAQNIDEGLSYIDNVEGNIVLKADGLAAGKGVIITDDKEHAKNTFKEMILDEKFGDAGKQVVIEEFLSGIELSVFVITDGKSYVILPEAKDYKRIGEGDQGLNTGGMGALSPVPFADDAFIQKIESTIIKPTIDGLNKENIDYRGFIFFGLIKVGEEPFVIEYNVRMGDPETEVVMLRIEEDLLDIIDATFTNNLADKAISFKKEAASTVMLVAGGYPESYKKGDTISGLNEVVDVIPFHAGTKLEGENVVTNGGRVIALSALGKDLKEALSKSNAAAEIVNWDKRYYRKDIGFDII